MPENSLIRAARQLLGRSADVGVTITIATPKRKVEIVADAEDVRRASEPPSDVLLGLACRMLVGEQERAILRLLEGQDMKADSIARQLGKDQADSQLRSLLALMSDRGLIESGRNGYRVSDVKVFELIRLADGCQLTSRMED